MSKVIGLTKGHIVLVDDEDYIWLTQWQWSYHNGGYACRGERVGGRSRMILMHRAILGASGDVYVDHINGDKLDNRRSNLRIATPQQSAYNTAKPNKNGYRGVTLHVGRAKPYQASIYLNGHKKSLGYYATAREAAAAYDAAAILYQGVFAKLNFKR